jgi:hypothetical protein
MIFLSTRRPDEIRRTPITRSMNPPVLTANTSAAHQARDARPYRSEESKGQCLPFTTTILDIHFPMERIRRWTMPV